MAPMGFLQIQNEGEDTGKNRKKEKIINNEMNKH